MATKRVPATIDEIADIIENYFSSPINDIFTKVYFRLFFDEFNSETEKQKCQLFLLLHNDVQYNNGIECSDEELLQAVELVHQRGKFPTDWPCTHKELAQECERQCEDEEEKEKSPATEPTK